jgi:predicted transcriptional regulator
MTKKERDIQVHALYEEMNSMQKVAEALNISKGLVHKILKNERPDKEVEHFVNEYKQIRENSAKSILKQIEDNSTAKIVERALGKLNDENMDYDVSKYGIGNMYRVVGMLTDKTLAIKDQEIRLKQLEIKQKELEIKEKELELRISSPEAFATYTIINDAPKVEDERTKPNTS